MIVFALIGELLYLFLIITGVCIAGYLLICALGLIFPLVAGTLGMAVEAKDKISKISKKPNKKNTLASMWKKMERFFEWIFYVSMFYGTGYLIMKFPLAGLGLILILFLYLRLWPEKKKAKITPSNKGVVHPFVFIVGMGITGYFAVEFLNLWYVQSLNKTTQPRTQTHLINRTN